MVRYAQLLQGSINSLFNVMAFIWIPLLSLHTYKIHVSRERLIIILADNFLQLPGGNININSLCAKAEHITTSNDDKNLSVTCLFFSIPVSVGAVRYSEKWKKKDLLLDIYSSNQRLLISKAQFLALSDTFKAFLCQISPLWNLQSSFFHAKTQNSMHILLWHAPNWVNKGKYIIIISPPIFAHK